jgi:hypothetical protein
MDSRPQWRILRTYALVATVAPSKLSKIVYNRYNVLFDNIHNRFFLGSFYGYVNPRTHRGQMKKVLYWYQRAMWHAGIFIAELDKPLTIFKYTSYAAVLMKVSGLDVSLTQIILAGVIALILAVLGGVILVRTGVLAYVTKLNNGQNLEIQEILKRLDQIDKKI